MQQYEKDVSVQQPLTCSLKLNRGGRKPKNCKATGMWGREKKKKNSEHENGGKKGW